MKKYECDVVIGTMFTFIGVVILYSLGLNVILGWMMIIVGKAIMFLGVTEYSDRKRAIRGYDLSNDNKFRKKIRKWRLKRYS